VGALECVRCLPDPVVSCGTAVCCIVQVEVRVGVAKVMDELQRLLGGTGIIGKFRVTTGILAVCEHRQRSSHT
jgi:hypothetical protein